MLVCPSSSRCCTSALTCGALPVPTLGNGQPLGGEPATIAGRTRLYQPVEPLIALPQVGEQEAIDPALAVELGVAVALGVGVADEPDYGCHSGLAEHRLDAGEERGEERVVLEQFGGALEYEPDRVRGATAHRSRGARRRPLQLEGCRTDARDRRFR